ncbi:MAG: hypothetical protein KAU94_09295 [Verrucomicrobia bacterium]|nr:hypothetical protein [Verrucomicrobiota bacterium]
MGKAKNIGLKPIQKLVKGMPGAVVLSILIHAGLFVLAGFLIVITITPPPAPPPPFVGVEPPPEMELPPPKPPVRVNTESTPDPPALITAEVDDPELHKIQALDRPPAYMGTDLNVDPGIDVTNMLSPLGPGHIGPPPSERIGNDMEGTYYDFKRNRAGSYNGEGQDTFRDTIRKFLKSGWNTSTLSRFYRAPEKRYPTYIMIPTMSSSVAPASFGEDPGSGFFWMVHCKGQIVYPEDITFRFWGVGDEILAVRVGKEVVFADIWEGDRDKYGNFWRGNDPQRKMYRLGHNTTMEVGDWVSLKAGVPRDIDILMGDNGGLAALMLLVEVKGVEYERNRQGGPILPIFKMSELSHDQLDLIYQDLSTNEACLTNGPVFKDY